MSSSFSFLAFLVVAGLFMIATPAMASSGAGTGIPSQPVSAMFFPNEVQVTVEEKLRVKKLPSGEQGVLLTLPYATQTDTFSLLINGELARGYYWEQEKDVVHLETQDNGVIEIRNALLPEDELSPERKILLTTVVTLQDEVAQKSGVVEATKARLALWQAQDSSESKEKQTAEELEKLDAAFSQRVPALHTGLEREQRLLEDAQVRLKKAEIALSEYDASHRYKNVIVPVEEGEGAELALRYVYTLPAAFSMDYRVEATPDKKSLRIDQDATIYQNSGILWDGVDVYLSTSMRDRTLQPNNITPWHVRLHDPNAVTAMAEYAAMDMAPAAPMAQVARSEEKSTGRFAQRAPVLQDRSTFRLWSLGKKRIGHDTPTRVSLSSESYAAKFFYTVRPTLNNKGFLTADITLDKALELPLGQAHFYVDGASVGQRNFSFNGDKATIFFGSDPQIAATVKNLDQTSGEKGFISKEKTSLWHWEITVKNTRKQPVDIVVEDAMPVLADTALKTQVTSTPVPEEQSNTSMDGGAKIYRWKFTLPPGQPEVINHKVVISAPADKDIVSSGRR